MATAVDTTTSPVRPAVAVASPGPVREVPPSGGFSLALMGVLALLVAAWGGIAPYVGPIFGFSADGTSAWQWTTAHAWLALLPGAVGVAAGLLLVAIAPRTAGGRGRADLAVLALLLAAAGGWFAVGPLAWPVLRPASRYFVGAPPLHELTYWIGYALGPGLLLCLFAGGVVGWALRRPRLSASTFPVAAGPEPLAVVPPAAAPPAAPAPPATATVPSTARTPGTPAAPTTAPPAAPDAPYPSAPPPPEATSPTQAVPAVAPADPPVVPVGAPPPPRR